MQNSLGFISNEILQGSLGMISNEADLQGFTRFVFKLCRVLCVCFQIEQTCRVLCGCYVNHGFIFK